MSPELAQLLVSFRVPTVVKNQKAITFVAGNSCINNGF